jgi:hypothetical protein
MDVTFWGGCWERHSGDDFQLYHIDNLHDSVETRCCEASSLKDKHFRAQTGSEANDKWDRRLVVICTTFV